MYNIQLLNKIAKCGTEIFGDNYNVAEDVSNADGIMVRSAAMHDMELPDSLLAIARAGAGVNNIPIDKCSDNGIVVFNTPGANANAVKELAICALLLASRKIVDGINWASTLTEDVAKAVEKGKSAYVGPELAGKTLGVIGLGAIGALLANTALHLGMNVYGYDPFITVDAAWRLSKSVKHAKSLDEIYANCDYISIHVPSTPDTKGMINESSIANMKDGVRIINLARADLVNATDIKKAIAAGKVGWLKAASSAVAVLSTGLVYMFVCLKAWAGAFGVGMVTQYISALSRQLANYSKNCHSGNKILDVLISKYVTECQLHGIDFHYDVKTCNLSGVDDIDIVSILGNLMDNALSAAAPSEGKSISLGTTWSNAYNVVVITNSCDNWPLTVGKKLRSTRKLTA